MVNEELSAKSIHFVVDYMVKPAARDLAKTLEKYQQHRRDKNTSAKRKSLQVRCL